MANEMSYFLSFNQKIINNYRFLSCMFFLKYIPVFPAKNADCFAAVTPPLLFSRAANRLAG